MTEKLWITWYHSERDEYALSLVNRAPSLSAKKELIASCASLFLDCDYYITKAQRYLGPIEEIKIEALVGDDIPSLLRHLWEIHTLTGRKVSMEANGSLIVFGLALP